MKFILYFIDGRADCFELNKEHKELEDAYNIDAGDGISECYRQLNEIDIDNLNRQQSQYVIVSNELTFLNQADEVYVYNKETKLFEKWEDIKGTMSIEDVSRSEIYLLHHLYKEN